jgi:hypothetical protein
MPEYGFQSFEFQRRRHLEHASAVTTTIRYQNMTMGVEAKEVAEGLDGDDGAGERIIFRNDILYEDLQRLPGEAAQAMQETEIDLPGPDSATARGKEVI